MYIIQIVHFGQHTCTAHSPDLIKFLGLVISISVFVLKPLNLVLSLYLRRISCTSVDLLWVVIHVHCRTIGTLLPFLYHWNTLHNTDDTRGTQSIISVSGNRQVQVRGVVYITSVVQCHIHTVFPRNLTVTRFNFKVLYQVATMREQQLQRLTRTRIHSFSSKPICMYA